MIDYRLPPMFQQENVFGNAGAFDGDAPALSGGAQVGASPDGLGAYAQPIAEVQAGGAQVHQEMPYPVGGVHGTWDMIEPEDVSQASAMRSAGFTALLATVALGTGIAVGGPWGAGAGVLLAGAAANGYRAQKWWGSGDPSEKHEAVVSAVFAVFGIGVGGYMAYKAYGAKKE